MSYKFFANAICCRLGGGNVLSLMRGSILSPARRGLITSGANFNTSLHATSRCSGVTGLMPKRLNSFLTSRKLSAQSAAKEQVVFINNNRYYLISTYILVLLAIPVAAYNVFVTLDACDPDNISRVQSQSPSVLFALFSSVLVLMAFVPVRFMLHRTFLRIAYCESSRQFAGVRCTWRLSSERVIFRPGDVKQLVDQSRSWLEFMGNVSVNGRPFYLPLDDFKSPYHYNLMLGLIKS